MGKLMDTLQTCWKGDQRRSEACHRSESSTISGKPSRKQCSGTGTGTKEEYQDETGIRQSDPEEGNRLEKWGPHDFELLACVGRGAFSTVFQCRKKGTHKIFAMKVITKSKSMNHNQVEAERNILTKVFHPFVVKLYYSFQTTTKLYLLSDFINGGNLYFHLGREGVISEDRARLYIAEIVCALTHIHQLGIAHRDLKPENILIDFEGHVKLTDFGLAKELDDSTRSTTFCGTLQYMAPEVILAKDHGKPADWWSVGILLYEMLVGETPFEHENRFKMQQKIVRQKFKKPTYLTSDAITLLKGFLRKDPSKRLGSGPEGPEEIKHHKWFKGVDWEKVAARELEPKFRPTVNGALCVANFDDYPTNISLEDSLASTTEVEGTPYFHRYSYAAPEP